MAGWTVDWDAYNFAIPVCGIYTGPSAPSWNRDSSSRCGTVHCATGDAAQYPADESMGFAESLAAHGGTGQSWLCRLSTA